MMLLLLLLTTAAALAETEIVSNIDGTEYTISDANDWNAFCDMLTDGETFSGKTVKLGANIEVTRMAGGQDHEFCGTFDGQGYTLTFNYTAEDSYCAPFRYTNGATIMKLNVAGTITTSKKYAAGLISKAYGTTDITDCRASHLRPNERRFPQNTGVRTVEH